MSVLAPARPVADPPQVSLGDLYVAFAQVSLSGFGGAIAWTRRKFVEQRRWLSEDEFAEVLSVCQFLPGPNIVNMAVFLGLRFQGALGVLAAVAGVVLAPFLVVLVLAALYAHFGDVEVVRRALSGVSAAAAGLIVSMGIKMALIYRRRPAGASFAGLAFLGAGLLQWPLYFVLLGLAPFSIAISWFTWRRRQ